MTMNPSARLTLAVNGAGSGSHGTGSKNFTCEGSPWTSAVMPRMRTAPVVTVMHIKKLERRRVAEHASPAPRAAPRRIPRRCLESHVPARINISSSASLYLVSSFPWAGLFAPGEKSALLLPHSTPGRPPSFAPFCLQRSLPVSRFFIWKIS